MEKWRLFRPVFQSPSLSTWAGRMWKAYIRMFILITLNLCLRMKVAFLDLCIYSHARMFHVHLSACSRKQFNAHERPELICMCAHVWGGGFSVQSQMLIACQGNLLVSKLALCINPSKRLKVQSSCWLVSGKKATGEYLTGWHLGLGYQVSV